MSEGEGAPKKKWEEVTEKKNVSSDKTQKEHRRDETSETLSTGRERSEKSERDRQRQGQKEKRNIGVIKDCQRPINKNSLLSELTQVTQPNEMTRN